MRKENLLEVITIRVIGVLKDDNEIIVKTTFINSSSDKNVLELEKQLRDNFESRMSEFKSIYYLVMVNNEYVKEGAIKFENNNFTVVNLNPESIAKYVIFQGNSCKDSGYELEVLNRDETEELIIRKW